MSIISKRTADLTPQEKRALLAQLLQKKAGSTKSFPLSFAQQRLWFLDQMNPGANVYNVPLAVRLTGPLDVAALEQSLQAVVRRHDTLRTTFAPGEDGSPVQLVAPALALPLPLIDLQTIPPEGREEEIRRLAVEEARRPFDLARGPLVRAALARLAGHDHVLLLTLHHIVSDGWSLGVLLRDVMTLYEAYAAKRTPALPQLPIQYGDYAVWQRQWLQGELLEKQLGYWKRRLDGAAPTLDLPTDRPRPAVQSFRGALLPFDLPGDLVDGLRLLAKQEDCTLYMVLLAAFQALLHRHSGQDDLSVGTPIAGRGRAETEGLVGFFVNTLVMRGDLSGDPTFRALLGRVRQTALEAYEHQDLPFERLVEALKLDRDLSHSPLFQALFVFHNSPLPAFEFSGLKVSQWDVDSGTSKFDLSLFLLEQGRGLRGTLEYSTDLYDAATAERLAGHYRTLLEAAAADPELPLSRLPLLTKEEQRQLGRFNDTAVAFPEEHLLHRLVGRQIEASPDAPAVTFEGRTLSYGELGRRALALAGRLRALGVGPDVPVGVCLERSPGLVAALLGVLQAGGAYLPLDPDHPAERLALMLKDARPPVVLAHRRLAGRLPEYAGRPLWIDDDGNAEGPGGDAPPAGGLALTPDHLAYVIYTSGSTGAPKGAMNTHEAICNRLLWMQQEYGLSPADAVLQKTPFSFDVSVWEFFWPLLAGARLALARPGGHQDPAYLAALIRQEQVTVCHFVPSMLRAFLREPGLEDSCASLREVVCSGEALPYDLQEAFFAKLPCRLHNLYGPTEAAVDVTSWECRRGDARPVVPIGKPVANTTMHVLDGHLRPVPVGVPGELYIGGVQLARGYLKRPQLTAERFLEAAGLGRLYKTGDRGRRLADGALEYLGRADRQVKLRGFRVELGEVEAALTSHPLVREAAVELREAAPGDTRLVAYVAPDFRERGGGADRASEQVAQWRAVWEETYGRGSAGHDAAFDTAGWDSSYTGLPLPDDDMREWLDHTVGRILALRPGRLLEVGCGSGLLLFRVAPHCRRYTAIDFSEAVLNSLRKQLAGPEHRLPQVSLLHRAAHELEGLGAAGFDTVVINSVLQYFPNVEYLLQVIEAAARVVRPGGRIFLGDVRNFRLLAAFHASVQLHKAPAALTRSQLLARVQSHVRQERELLVDPAFFHALRRPIPRIRRVEIQLKRGRCLNEMTRFRYDVVLHLDGEPAPCGKTDIKDWQNDKLTLASVRRLLEDALPDRLDLLGVPNARLGSEVKVLELLSAPDGPETADDLRAALREARPSGADPEEFFALGSALAFDTSVGWSQHGGDACCDVHFRRPASSGDGAPCPPAEDDPPRPWEEYANDPLRGKVVRGLPQLLRDHLRKTLPEYMTPSAFVLLDALPLSPNGKLDRKALPAPEQSRPELDEAYVAPRTPTEQTLADLWAAVLGLERVGVQDNFFELGGHSLLATQVVSRMRKAVQVELPLRVLFEAPTVAELAVRVEEARRAAMGLPAAPLRPIPRDGELPLSFGQETFWFLEQMEPGSPVFNIDVAVRLRGPLDLAVAEQALGEVLRRHETLRTSFAAAGGRPTTVIAPPAPLTLPVHDLTGLPEPAREAEARRLADEESRQPFDLARGPLFRIRLLRLGPEDHVGLLTVHHSVYDGWSMGVFLREVGLLYEAFGAGRPSPLPELAIQYVDFAHWQRQWLQSGLMEEQLAYWKKRLAGPLPVLELPADRPRPAARTFHGARRLMVLPPTLTAALHALSRREGCTLYMVLLAAFQALLHRYTGLEDLCVGTPIAGRNRAETEGLIGFFVNTLVMRADLSGNPTFRALLQRTREAALGAYAHQDLPFERLMQALNPARDLSHSPLFQVMFILQNAPLKIPSISGLSSRPLLELADNGTSKFDLTLTLMEGIDGLTGTAEYNTDLFEDATIERLLGHYRTLLEAVVAGPDLELARLPLLTQAEKRQLDAWGLTRAAYPEGECIHDLLEAQAARTPDAVAVVGDGRRLSYGELNRRANRLARRLRSLGVGPEGLVGLYIDRSPELLVGLLAVLKAGGAYVPLDPAYPGERVAAVIEDAGLRWLLTQSVLADDLPRNEVRLVCVDAEEQEPAPDDNENLTRSSNEEKLAYVIYTSGSTGKPKGVMLAHRGLCNAYRGWEDVYRLRSDATSHLQMASCAFDVFTGDWTRALCSGGKLVLCPRELLLDAPRLYELMRREEVDCAEFVPAVLRNLVNHLEQTGQTLAFMRLLAAGSDVWYAGEYRRIKALCGPATRLVNSYGLTEATIDSTYFEGTALDLAESRPVPIGRPFANSRIRILDHNLQPVPVGAAGELHVGGPGLARGYFNRPELTAEKFIADPFGDAPGDRLFRTGDLARWLPDGCVELLGRSDDQVKIRGFRIEPGEIESVLGRHPAVRQAVVVVRGDTPDRKHLVAYLTTDGPAPAAAEWRAFLKDKLPEYMVPSAFVVLEAMPLTPNGKIDRKALPAVEAVAPEARADFVSPRTSVEEKVAGVWAEVLGVGRVGVHDDFFELGGHSLLATQVISRLGQAFAVELPLRRLFETPTVAGLAEAVEAARLAGQAGQLPPLEAGRREEPPPLSFAQQRLWFLDQFEPNSPYYNIPAAARFTGALDQTALERSLHALVRRHETLRTTFQTVEGRQLQVVVPTLDLPLSCQDLSGLPLAEREREARRFAREEARRPFDLERGPLFRVALLKLAPREHVVVLVIHHIVSDGWSMKVFFRDLAALYHGFAAGKQARLPELPVQYADYACWQRRWLQGEVLDAQLAYWKDRLAGAPALETPTDRPRPPVQGVEGATHSFLLPKELGARLKALARRENCTLYMILLTAFQTILHRYSGQEDISVGTPIAGRRLPQLEGLIGFFVNTLVLRLDLSRDPTFRELLGRAREITLGAYAHQDVPFEMLVEALRPQRDLSRTPLFQVMFIFLNAPVETAALPGLSLTPMEADSGTAKFDLSLAFEDTDRGLVGSLEYSTDLYDAATAERLAGHYRTLLEAVAADPELPLSRLPLLTQEERLQLGRFNDTAVAFPEEHLLHRLVGRQIEASPDAPAVTCDGRTLSYRELGRRALALAGRLRALGVGPDAAVGVCLERSPGLVAALLGVLQAGGAYLPLDPDHPAGRLALMLKDAAPTVVLAHRRLAGRLPDCAGRPLWLDDDGNAEGDGGDAPPAGGLALTPDHLAYVIYTSGSTGAPKGAMNTHQGICNRLLWMQQEYRLSPSDAVLQKTPFSFDVSVWELFWPLLAGARLVLARPGGHKDPAYLAALIHDEQVTVCHFVPSMLRAFLREPGLEHGCASLRDVMCSGEALPYELQEAFFARLPCRLHNLYGPTEAAVDVTSWQCRRGDPRQVVPIGRPVANTHMHVLDGGLRPLPVGVPGELYIGGVQLARGYLNRPQLTAERFVEAAGLGRLYKTGDRGRRLADGALEYLGRADRQVKLRGFRVELGEVEAALCAHPLVREAAVELREAAPGDQRLVAYVAPDWRERGVDRASEQVAQWRAVWEETYGRGGTGGDAAFDTAGWDSSYTGLPLPDDDMREWLDHTVGRILALRPGRLLEVGCGSGLLLFRLAPHCRRYTAIDFSEQAIRSLRERTARVAPPLPPVDLRQGTADDLADLQAGEFDTVVLNSVTQYFPDIEYLLKVLEGAIRVVRLGGHVFVGDVRNLGLLEAFHASVQLHRAADSLPVGSLRERIRRKASQERELLIDPAFFPALMGRFPSITRVALQVKRGRLPNEMTAFRYDVVLHVGGPAAPAPQPAWADYDESGLDLTALRRLLEERRPDTLALAGVPNARIAAEVRTLKEIAAEPRAATAGDLRRLLREQPAQPAIDPEDLWHLGESLSYAVDIGWSAKGREEGRFDVLFRRRTHAGIAPAAVSFPAGPAARRDWWTYGNDPLRGQAAQTLPAKLRDFLKERLPEYMVPSAFVVLDALPLSPNGKLDRKALPAPDQDRPDSQGAFAPPRTPTEELLASIWAEVLGVTRVGVHDNFFDLGGHSLQAVQVAARVSKALGRTVPVKALFLYPTVASLAAAGAGAASDDAADLARADGAAAPSDKAPIPSLGPLVTLERRPLLPLFESGELAPVQAAAIGYLPTSWLEYTGLSPRDMIEGWCAGRPVVSGVYETPLGRIGLMLVPRFDSQLYQDPEDLVGVLRDALQTAGRLGARVVSLTGLLPSATRYGQALQQAVAGQDVPRVTTGHATTTAAVVLSVRRILEESGRDFTRERVGFVGLGSVGAACFRTLLRCLPHPAEIRLCDVYGKRDALLELRREVVEDMGYRGPVHVLEVRGAVPREVYESSLLVGASNVPDILDVDRLAPGALLVDDSSPHCFRLDRAIRRQREREDILFTYGGVLRAPIPLRQVLYVPEGLEQVVRAVPAELFANHEPRHIMGCVLSALLSARQAELPPTLGLAAPQSCLDHYRELARLGFRAAALHCESYRPDEESVLAFRRAFGQGEESAAAVAPESVPPGPQ